MIKFFEQKNKKVRSKLTQGFTHTPFLVSLHAFLTTFSKRFNIFSNKEVNRKHEQDNRKEIPRKVSGFTLVETLVAIAILSVSIVTLMSVLAQGISNTGYARKKTIAGYLTQEGIEYIRNMRDSYVLYNKQTGRNWTQFRNELTSCNRANKCGFDSSFYLTKTNSNFIFKCTSNPSGCALFLNNGNYNSNSSGKNSGFTRKIWITTTSPNEVKIFTTVSWTQKSEPFSITLSESLFNWTE